jgi:AcrR family transcriptional regulator
VLRRSGNSIQELRSLSKGGLPPGKAVKKKPDRKLTRCPPEQRQEMILSGALSFFAKHGFEADTRELANQMGISQALIYRYFNSKKALIDSVYERIYTSRWKSEWKRGLMDHSMTLNYRLKRFYKSYLSAFDQYEWIRISVFSGLKGNDLVRRYFRSVVERVIRIIARELRRESRLPVPINGAVADIDLELAWNFHAGVIYLLMRRHIFQVTPRADNDALVEQTVDQLLPGSISVLKNRNQEAPRSSGRHPHRAGRRASAKRRSKRAQRSPD